MNASNHIIDFSKASKREKSRKGAKALPVLIKQVQNLFIKSLEVNLISMLNSADDRLFDMAEHIANNSQFDAMRLLRVKREALISGFVRELDLNFDKTLCKDSSHLSESHSEDTSEDISIENITLVKDEDLEENIAADVMVKKAQQSNQYSLQNIRIRLDTFFSDRSVEQDNNPLEPYYVCDAFRNSTQSLDIDITSLLVIYKLFERSIMSQLDNTYEEVNNFFIENGILPELKNQAVKAKIRVVKQHHSDDVDSLPINENQNNSTTQSAEILSVIQQLLAEQRAVSEPSTPSTQLNSDLNDHQIPSLQNTLADNVKIDTLQLVQALSNLQASSKNTLNSNQSIASSAPDLRTSINHQLPNLISSSSSQASDSYSQEKSFGQFNDDMIEWMTSS